MLPLPVEIDDALRQRFGVDTFSGAYGVTEASLVSWQPPGVENRPNAAGVINDEYFDVRIFDDDAEQPRGTDGEIVLRPKRPHTMFEGYWGSPGRDRRNSRNWWYHTGDIGRIDDDGYLYFVDRKADYLRRRGRTSPASRWSGSSCSTRRSRMSPCTRCRPSSPRMTLKITATVREGETVAEADLFRWCIDRSRTSLPRYIELRRAAAVTGGPGPQARPARGAVTDAWWDAEASGITYDKR